MEHNAYDKASRYWAKLDPSGMFAWLLGTPSVRFLRWLDTRRIPFPGSPDRTGDTLAELEEPSQPGERWVVALEFMLEPDSDLFYRLLIYLGHIGLEERPSPQPGDRYRVGAAVVNLTGVGRTSQVHQLGATGMRTALDVLERNLSREDAAATLTGIAAGTIAPVLLPVIPLMQGGDEAGMIQQWIALASAEPDGSLRSDYGALAVVFAEAAGRGDVWKQALKGWNMVQSQQVLEWMAQGKAEGKAETLLLVLRARFGSVPQDLETAIRSTTDLATLDTWADTAVRAATLADFRRTTNL